MGWHVCSRYNVPRQLLKGAAVITWSMLVRCAALAGMRDGRAA